MRAGVRICEDVEELTSVGVHLWGPAPRRPAKAATRAPDVDGHASDGAALKLDLAGVHSSTDPTSGQKADRLNHGAHLLLGFADVPRSRRRPIALLSSICSNEEVA